MSDSQRKTGRPAPKSKAKGTPAAGKGAARGAGKAGAGASGAKKGGSAKEPASKRRRPAGGSGAKGGPSGRAVRPLASEVGSTRVRDRARLSEKMGRSTRLRLFLESSLLDFLLVLLVSAGLTFTVSFGFDSAADYRGNVALVVALTAPLLVALFAGSWSKRALAPSIAATVVLAVALVAGALVLSPEPLFADGAMNDVEGNYGIFAIVAALVPVLVFLLSRRPAGLVFLLVASVLACGTIQFLYRDWVSSQPGIPATVAVLLGIGMMFVYQCYRQSVYSANRVKRTSFAGAFAFSAVVGAVCVLVGVAVFYGVVQVMDWTTPEIKPFESYVSPPEDESASDYELMSEQSDDTSSETNDDKEDTGEEGKGGNQSSPSLGGLLKGTFIGDMARQMAGLDPNDDDPEDQEANEFLIEQYTMLVLGVLLVLLALAVVLLWRGRRSFRLRRIARRSEAYQAWYLYTFLMGRFRRLKIRKPPHLTPLEFAVGFSKAMLPFTRDAEGVDFVDVTCVYQDAVFGGCQPSADELQQVKAYYRAFFKNARRHVGWPKWVLWGFWRI